MTYSYEETKDEIIITKGIATRELMKEYAHGKEFTNYEELEKALYDNYEDAWLFWEMTPIAFRKNIMGFNLQMFLKYRLSYWFTHPMWFKEGGP